MTHQYKCAYFMILMTGVTASCYKIFLLASQYLTLMSMPGCSYLLLRSFSLNGKKDMLVFSFKMQLRKTISFSVFCIVFKLLIWKSMKSLSATPYCQIVISSIYPIIFVLTHFKKSGLIFISTEWLQHLLLYN